MQTTSCGFCNSSNEFDTFLWCSFPKCRKVYHISCVYPPVRRSSRKALTTWKCQECINKPEKPEISPVKIQKRVKKHKASSNSNQEQCSRSLGYSKNYKQTPLALISVAMDNPFPASSHSSRRGSNSSENSRKNRASRRALSSSLGSEGWAVNFHRNSLQSSQKQLRLVRSSIHAFGVLASESIRKDDLVIEYIGEIVRSAVADKREKLYESVGIGSSYLFRIDQDMIIDATFKGNLARFINHSCDPNCRTQVVSVGSSKRIAIYAKRDIEEGEELAYDYKFPIEEGVEKIPCHCGTSKCRLSLN